MATTTSPSLPPSASAPRPSGSRAKAPSFFQKKELGVPIWGWVLIIGGGAVIYIIWARSQTSSASTSGTLNNAAQPPLSYGSGGGAGAVGGGSNGGGGGFSNPLTGVGKGLFQPAGQPLSTTPPVSTPSTTPAAGATAPAPVYRLNPTGYTVPQFTQVSSTGVSTPSTQTVQSAVPANFYPSDWQQIGLPTPAIGTPISNGIAGQYTLYTG
jgi:hypothetical protein